MSFPMALFVTVLLLIGSGFFVAAEFALVASSATAWNRPPQPVSAARRRRSPGCRSCR